MRTLLFLLVLAGPALAGPGSWKVIEQGGHLEDPMQLGKTTGNAQQMNVRASALRTRVDVMAYTDWTTRDESGSGSATETTWLTLKFAGGANTTGHKWRIESRVHGDGTGAAYANLDCSTWAETVQVEQLGGDVTNQGVGQIGVDDSGNVDFSLGIPTSLHVGLAKSRRSKGSDVYQVDSPKASSGAGKACRVRVDDYAAASVSACSTLGAGHATAWGTLRTDLLMVGTCRLPDGTLVADQLKVTGYVIDGEPVNVVADPSGGRAHADGIPPDKPTDGERAGTDDDGTPVDAGTLGDGATDSGDAAPPDDGGTDAGGTGSTSGDSSSGSTTTSPDDGSGTSGSTTTSPDDGSSSGSTSTSPDDGSGTTATPPDDGSGTSGSTSGSDTTDPSSGSTDPDPQSP